MEFSRGLLLVEKAKDSQFEDIAWQKWLSGQPIYVIGLSEIPQQKSFGEYLNDIKKQVIVSTLPKKDINEMVAEVIEKDRQGKLKDRTENLRG